MTLAQAIFPLITQERGDNMVFTVWPRSQKRDGRSRNACPPWVWLLALLLSWLLIGCTDRLVASPPPSLTTASAPVAIGKLAEVPPPPLLQELGRSLDQYQPQVKILNPQPEEVLNDTTVSIKLAVQDLPIFQNPDLEMGPHIHLIVDNQPYQAIYNLDEPIILKDLTAGTHTLRVFPVRPWHESFKNDGAFAQTTFHVLTKMEDNRPDPALPLLTYSRPKGSYGAEPILLDFYLTNAPLHLIAQENPEDAIADWRIRVTINNESFMLDKWQPIYLTGFEKGQNWVKLEFIDEQGNLVPNAFNSTVRVIDYAPNGQDTLSQLVRGELPLEVAKSLINPDISVPQIPQKVEPPTISLPLEEETVPIPSSTDVIEESPISEELPPVAIESDESQTAVSPTSESSSTDSSIPEALTSPVAENISSNSSIENENSSSMTKKTTEALEETKPSEIDSTSINSLHNDLSHGNEISAGPEKTTHNP
ncbi:MAG: hypothetical protein ACKO2V_16575 [Snowella sp.]